MKRGNASEVRIRAEYVPAVGIFGRLLVLMPILIILSLAIPVGQAVAAQTTLTWDPPRNADGTLFTGFSGYKVYFGTASRTYSQSVDVGNVTSVALNSLSDGVTYFFAVTDYDGYGNESSYSNEVSKTFPSRYTLTASYGSGGTITAAGAVPNGQVTNGTTTVLSFTVDRGTGLSFSITPAAGYVVSNVTVDGVSVGSTASYAFQNVTSEHSISATFAATTCQAPPAKISGGVTPFQDVQAAYDAATNGSIIQIQAEELVGDLVGDRDISITMDGGYSCDYTTRSGFTTINGTIRISAGLLRAGNIVVK